jgi:putative aminopeptidase FrvX
MIELLKTLTNLSGPCGYEHAVSYFSIPSRYAHSPVEVIDYADLEATKDLVKAFILNLEEDQKFPF